MWKELNKEAMANVWVVPTRFGREQRLAGSKVHSASGDDGNPYLWAPYGSWPYNDMWVEQ
jgi:peptide/nickel transport system substrate-binding protein